MVTPDSVLRRYAADQIMYPDHADGQLAVPMHRQETTWSCGAASVRSVLLYFGIDVPEATLRDELGTNSKDGTEPQAIVSLLESKGLRTEAKQLSVDDLYEAVDRGEVVIIDLQAWAEQPTDYRTDWADGHYVVLSGYEGDRFYFADPASYDHIYLPVGALPDRWHDVDADGFRTHHLGIVVEAPLRQGGRQAGTVVPLKPKAGVPTVTIGGRKYALSTDGGPLGDRDEDDAGWLSESGARLIGPPAGINKWRYLWAYCEERHRLIMWRVTDGNEKADMSDRESAASVKIVKLEKKGQLNRVTADELRRLEAEMRKREDAVLESMQRYLEDAKDEATKQLDMMVRSFFGQRVLGPLLEGIRRVQEGITPMGFKPMGNPDPVRLKRQQASYVLGNLFDKEMTTDKVRAFLTKEGFDLSLVDPQALQWAIDDVHDEAGTNYLPSF